MPTAKKSARKSARKTAPTTARKANSAVGVPFAPGPDPRRGKGPAPGAPNAGRPPDEFKALCAELATGAATLAAVRAILESPLHPQFMHALKWATEHGYGRATQPIEQKTDARLTVRFIQE